MPARLAPATPPPPRNPDIIKHYHAHVYYDPTSTRERAHSHWRRRAGIYRWRNNYPMVAGHMSWT